MAEYVLAGAGASDGRIAFEIPSVQGQPSQTLSYGTLRTHVKGIATGLLSYGLRPGDRLLFRLGNRLEFPLAYLAALYVGIIPVPTSAQLTAAEVAALCRICHPHAILSDGSTALPDGTTLPLITTDALRGMHVLPPAAPQRGDPNRLAYIIFTSGTSGTPRGVCHAHRAIWARRMMHQGWYGLSNADRMLHAGAFNWTYTLGTGLMDPWSVGATALVTPEGTPVSELPMVLAQNNISIFAARCCAIRSRLPCLPCVTACPQASSCPPPFAPNGRPPPGPGSTRRWGCPNAPPSFPEAQPIPRAPAALAGRNTAAASRSCMTQDLPRSTHPASWPSPRPIRASCSAIWAAGR